MQTHRGPAAHGPGNRSAILCGIGAALPPKVMSNADLCARLDTTDEWIRTRTGITHRRIAGAEVSTEDLAAEAAAEALRSSGRYRVQALVLATTTPDRRCPATAPGVAARLGLTGIPALDLAAGCTGFLYALATVVGFIAAGMADAVVVIGADRLSTLPAPLDRSTVPLFGDAAGAVVLRRGSASDPGAIGPMVLGSDGAHNDLIRATHGGALEMHGSEVFRHAVSHMAAASTQAARAVGWRIQDVDRLVPHQANARITDFVARKLAIPEGHQVHNVEHVGNTGAASIPLLLAQAAADGRIAPGHRVLLAAFGAGLTWGATTLTWPDLTLRPANTGTPTCEGVAVNGVLEAILLNDLKVPADRLSPAVGLDDAGLDSLAIVELSELLGERLGIDVSHEEVKGATTIGALDRLIEQKRTEG